jgi:hypothetical protein
MPMQAYHGILYSAISKARGCQRQGVSLRDAENLVRVARRQGDAGFQGQSPAALLEEPPLEIELYIGEAVPASSVTRGWPAWTADAVSSSQPRMAAESAL